MTKLYRVYKPYHTIERSGTIELGYYSGLKLAQNRLKKVHDDLIKSLDKLGSHCGIKLTLTSSSLKLSDVADDAYYYIQKITVDKDTRIDNTNYV